MMSSDSAEEPESEAEDQHQACYEKGLDLLARRAHFRLELEQKLRSRGFEGEIIEGTLGRLSELGYLDEQATAEHYVAGRLRRGRLGPRRLEAELRQRGVDDDIARRVVSAQVSSQGDEDTLIREAADRWLRSKGHRAAPAALARHLERAGFAARLVLAQVRSFEAQPRHAPPDVQEGV